MGTGLNIFESDRLVNYEAGIKSTLFDGRVRANISGFYQKWKNFQLELEDATTTAFGIVTQNIAGATIHGIEAEVQANPIEGLEMGTAFTIIDATSDVTVPFGDTGDIAVSEGEKLPTVADFKLTASLQYTHAVNLWEEADAYVRFDFTHVGDSKNGIPGSVFLFGGTPLGMPMIQQDYQIGNLSFGLNFERFDLSLKLNNIWDERAQLFIHPRFNDNRVVTNTPRNIYFGVRARL